MKRYSQIVESSLDAEFKQLYEEASTDPRKMRILMRMLDEEVANTASAPGLAGVSNGEPPPVSPLQGGFPILRRKKKRRSDLMEMALRKEKKATTGHLEHVGDYLYHGDPSVAMNHMHAMHQRFKGKTTKGHQPSLKIDGGHSVVAGVEHNGTHFVRSKHGGEDAVFRSEEDIHKTGKEHYVRDLVPVLHHIKKTKIKPGTAYQMDIVHHGDANDTLAKPNTITYKKKPGAKLTIAAHSQYKLSEPNEPLEKPNKKPGSAA